MRMNEGVEWAVHSCLNLTWVEPGQGMTARALAAFYQLPPAYLNKQLQALTRAGILSSGSGPRGGFQLARRPEKISLLDVVIAIEGSDEAFRCDEILRRGPGGRAEIDYRKTCLISQAMAKAELAWRQALAAQTIADLKAAVERQFPAAPGDTRNWFAKVRA